MPRSLAISRLVIPWTYRCSSRSRSGSGTISSRSVELKSSSVNGAISAFSGELFDKFLLALASTLAVDEHVSYDPVQPRASLMAIEMLQ